MDIRDIFRESSEKLLSEFRKASRIKHPGGMGSLREEAFKDFLREHLPGRYAIGQGEVITPENRVSGQLDVVIYDSTHCPTLIKSPSHSVYPIESVYGALSIKSHLDSAELQEAYNNITSLKSIIIKRGFTQASTEGILTGMSHPVPVTGIVAYDANRSLDAIASQAASLDAALPDLTLRPDFIAVLDHGIVGPREPLRGSFNDYKLPESRERIVELRRTGRHTLYRVYLQIIREFNTITLRPPDLHAYDDMPRLVGKYRVKRHDRFVKELVGQQRVCRLNEAAIREIVSNSKPTSRRRNFMNTFAQIPDGAEGLFNLDDTVYEYNPGALPPLSPTALVADASGRIEFGQSVFQPVPLWIDGREYFVDVSSFATSYFEEISDFSADELLAE